MEEVPPGQWDLDDHNSFEDWLVDLAILPGARTLTTIRNNLRTAHHKLGLLSEPLETEDDFDFGPHDLDSHVSPFAAGQQAAAALTHPPTTSQQSIRSQPKAPPAPKNPDPSLYRANPNPVSPLSRVSLPFTKFPLPSPV